MFISFNRSSNCRHSSRCSAVPCSSHHYGCDYIQVTCTSISYTDTGFFGMGSFREFLTYKRFYFQNLGVFQFLLQWYTYFKIIFNSAIYKDFKKSLAIKDSCCFRNRKHELQLMSMAWKINYNNLVFSALNNGYSSSSSRISKVRERS